MLRKKSLAGSIVLIVLLAGFIVFEPRSFGRTSGVLFSSDFILLFFFFIAGLLLIAALIGLLRSILPFRPSEWSPRLKMLARSGFVVSGILVGWILAAISGEGQTVVRALGLFVDLLPPLAVWMALLVGYMRMEDSPAKSIVFYLLVISQGGMMYYYVSLSPAHLALYLVSGVPAFLIGAWPATSSGFEKTRALVLRMREQYWSAKDARTRKIIYYTCTSLVVLPLILFALETNTWRLAEELWFDTLTRARGVQEIEESPVTIIDFADGWPGKERFFQLLTLLDTQHPRVIGINIDQLPFLFDSLQLRSMQRMITHSKVVLTSSRQFDYPRNMVPDVSLDEDRNLHVYCPQSRVSFAYHTVRGRHLASRLTPMWYQPTEERWKSFEVGNLRLADFGTKILMVYSGLDTLEIDRGVLREDGTILINHYFPDLLHSNVVSPRLFNTIVHFSEPDNQSWIWIPFGEERRFRFNPERGRLAAGVFDTRGNWSDTATVAQIEEIQGKIVLVDIPLWENPRPYMHPSQSFSVVYGSIIQNFLTNELITEPGRAEYYSVSILLFLFLGFSFFRLNPWIALIIDIILILGIPLLAIFLFSQSDMFVHPLVFMIPLFISAIFFFPYELSFGREIAMSERTTVQPATEKTDEPETGVRDSRKVEPRSTKRRRTRQKRTH
ncbi:MAG: hypothetical protein HY563_00065 [Ignavibacteriales bacterium]|nr:hypothetical protein [Ignavibacteriales bacterium]